jgi:hypothetical protein
MIKQTVTAAMGAVAITAGFFLVMDYAFSIPEVHKSYSTNQCLRVETFPGVFFGHEFASCERLPSKYDLVWHK